MDSDMESIKECDNFSYQETGSSVISGDRNVEKPGKRINHSFCPICNKRLLKRALNRHLLKHQSPQYRCGVCFKWYRTAWNLAYHMRIHTGEKPFKCSFCDKWFTRLSGSTGHENLHTKENQCKCTTSGAGFRAYADLANHKLVHPTENAYRCGCCGKEFRKKESLVRHMLVHEAENQNVCDICGAKFKSRFQLMDHAWLHGNGGQMPCWTLGYSKSTGFYCKICRKHFQKSFKNHFESHFETSGSNSKNAYCSGKRKTYDSLKQHLLTHGVLNQGTIVNINKPNDIESTNNLSDVCNNVSQEKTSANEQSQVCENNDLKCHICELKFQVLQELKLHVLTHYEESKYCTCWMCGEILLDCTYIDEHLLEHSTLCISTDPANKEQTKVTQANIKL